VTTAKAKAYHHGDLKAALVAAASAMLEKEGPEAISFRAIARAVGVSQTAPYNHFEGKEHLLATVAEAGFRELHRSQVAAGAAARTPAARVLALGEAYVAFARAHPQLYRLMFGVGILDWRAYPEAAAAAEAAYGPLQQAMAAHLGLDGSAGPALATASITAWSVVHGLAMLIIDNKIDPSEAGLGGAEALTAEVTSWLMTGLDPGRVPNQGRDGADERWR
jgi:AcrR family transcriptional regulator